MNRLFVCGVCRARAAVAKLLASERGDVPGWVMVTLMTAGLVALLWAVAGPALTGLFNQAIAAISGIGG